MRVGTIVRVPLHGRQVRGWVVADDVDPEGDARLLPDRSRSSSDGPPADVVALTEWIARRWCGPASPSCAPRRPPTTSAPHHPTRTGVNIVR